MTTTAKHQQLVLQQFARQVARDIPATSFITEKSPLIIPDKQSITLAPPPQRGGDVNLGAIFPPHGWEN